MLKLCCVLLHLTPQPILTNPDLRLPLRRRFTQGPNWSKFRLCRNQPLLEIRRHRVSRFDLIVQILQEREDSSEYEELLEDLRDQYQPVGRAEELEVERITLCWWRLKRAARFENAENRVAMRDIGRKELA